MPARMRPDGGQDVHRKFLNQFACRKSNSATQRPSPLSAEEHAAHRKQLEGIHFVQPKFSTEHEINVTDPPSPDRPNYTGHGHQIHTP